MSRAELKRDLLEWDKNYKRTASENTAIFLRVINDLKQYGEPFAIGMDVFNREPEPYTSLFRYKEYSRTNYPMESFEDLVAIRDLLKVCSIKEETHRDLRRGCVMEGLFYRPGWATEHNQWFMEEIKDIKYFRTEELDSCKLDPVPIEADCQFEFIKKMFKTLKIVTSMPNNFMEAVSREESLWKAFEECQFEREKMEIAKPGMFDSLFPDNVSAESLLTAGRILYGKPVTTEYEYPIKNILIKTLHGDSAILKPFVDCYFDSVDNVWTKNLVYALRYLCEYSLHGNNEPFLQMLRELVFQSPSRILAKYFVECGNPDKAAIHKVISIIDFHDLASMNEPKKPRLEGYQQESTPELLLSVVNKSKEGRNKFLREAPIEAVIVYLEFTEESKHFRCFEQLNQCASRERINEVLKTGKFVESQFFYHNSHQWVGFDDESCCYESNLEKMLMILPSRTLNFPQALINLVLETDMPPQARTKLLQEMDGWKCVKGHEEYFTKLKLNMNTFETNLETVLENIPEQTIMDDQKLLQTIAHYLYQKCKAGTASPLDLGPKVRLALCLVTSKLISDH